MPVLAIDQGTTSTRALLLEDSGVSRVIAVIEHRQIYSQSGWVEHDPEELLRNIQTCLQMSGPIDAIGFDNQGESCLAWHADTGQALSPVIVWQDNRTQLVTEELIAQGAEALVQQRTGLPLDCYFSATKMAWILQNIPAARQASEQGKLRLGTSDAFFLDRLCGQFVTDITTASRTSLMNLQTAQWDSDLCQLFGVPITALPQIKPSVTEFGRIAVNGTEVPVTASIVDQQASLYGHGCRQAGDAKITFGSGAFALVVTGTEICRAPDLGLLPTVAWQVANKSPVYALDGGVYCAGSAINWARSLGLFSKFQEINHFDTPSAIERNLVFVPALAGLACPHWDRRAAGMWLGMALDTTAQDLIQAVLEGIAMRASEVLTAMSEYVPINAAISIDGGVSANPYFCQFLANVLEREVMAQDSAELTAFGTACLAAGVSHLADVAHPASRRYLPDKNLIRPGERYKEAVKRCSQWLV